MKVFSGVFIFIGLIGVFSSCKKINGCAKRHQIYKLYETNDSSFVGMTQEWNKRGPVEIEVMTCEKKSNTILLKNILGRNLTLTGTVSGNTFDMPNQDLNHDYYQSGSMTGTIYEDSIEYSFYYLNDIGDPLSIQGSAIIVDGK